KISVWNPASWCSTATDNGPLTTDSFSSRQKLLEYLVRDQVRPLRDANSLGPPFDPPFPDQAGNCRLPATDPRPSPALACDSKINARALPQAQEEKLLELVLRREPPNL